MSFVITPPRVSIPSDNGVTSSNSTSFTSPVRTPPWIEAPIATTSSGFTPFEGSFLKKSRTMFWMAGIRVEPPTKITSSMSLTLMPASAKALRHGSIVAWMRSSHNCSNLALESLRTKCLGPLCVAVIYGRLISVSVDADNSIFAFSAASFNLWSDIGSLRRSMFSSFMNSSASQLMILSSKSSPPRWVLPFVDFTSNTPSPSSRIEISNVPPPRSYTATFTSLFFLSKPYAKAAAVGSLMIRRTFKPAISPASLVA